VEGVGSWPWPRTSSFKLVTLTVTYTTPDSFHRYSSWENNLSSFPKRADHFREWSKLMLEQAVVPDRPQYKSSNVRSLAGKRRKRRNRRRTRRQGRKNAQE